ncbi:MAG: hypothetical protein QF878_06275, partial [SAR202 cluster bacterium]|nr:hypothetical protein [SAR202 cluster bacterium]
MSQLRYQPEKVAVGTAYIYEKSNIDGSHKSDIVQYIASQDSLEAFKWEKGESEATLVTAKMNWDSFSVQGFKSSKIRANGKRIVYVTLDQTEDTNQVVVAGDFRSQKFEQTVIIESYPWHSYDFDFASLNVTLPHYTDPLVPFTFGITDFDYKALGPSISFKGLVTVDFVSEEERHDARCHKYNIDGMGLENRGGTIWIDKIARHIVDYEIECARISLAEGEAMNSLKPLVGTLRV